MPQFRPYGQTRAVCGYYLRDSRLCISCVSAEETSQAMMMRFDNEAAKRRYMERAGSAGGAPRAPGVVS